MNNILIINGSPKNKYSITLQTSLYLQEKFKDCNFEIHNVAKLNNDFKLNPQKVFDLISYFDIIIFSYPVYTFIAPYQLHLFIQNLKNSNFSFDGKIATQITTSKHFYDVTAHQFIKENALDLGFNFVEGLSADMEDLRTKQGQTQAENFFKRLLWSSENSIFDFYPLPIEERRNLSLKNSVDKITFTNKYETVKEKDESKEVVIVTDLDNSDIKQENLKLMIENFIRMLPYKTKIVNIREYPFKGGCLGCFKCASNGKCFYKDNFDEFLRTEVQTASSIVYAFSIKDHSMGSIFKLYDDRQFCNGHRTVTKGMPIAYLVSGKLSQEENLNTIIKARGEVGGNFIAGIVCDQTNSSQPSVEDKLNHLVQNLIFAFENNYSKPSNFYGVGGMKIFRDLIYEMQGMMKADHKFYKKNGFYNDMPHKKKGRIFAMYLVGLLNSPKLQEKIGNKMNEGMIAPYKKVINNIDKK